ncbi:helix-turn-helix domain-containing protein [Clostridium sp. AN503]|uniref:TetR/AcrR family transcriptional regulator n=1 Tax=Clostridium sp. AN503 TaxID=3160598 RepID=UPI00345A4FC6
MGARNLEEELIAEGIRQLKENGMDGFSARAVADACHVSCAAPFKYFKGRQEFFLTISRRLDEELSKSMEAVRDRFPGRYKEAHLAMNEAYIGCLCKYPFLIDPSFWHTIDETQLGIRKWKSFRMMADQFRFYCREHNLSKELERAYYFNFQTLAYGSAFVINSGLMLEGERPEDRIRELQQRIYENLEKTAGR